MSKDLSSLNPLQLQEFLDSFDHIFCDVDGVLWFFGGSLFKGVTELFAKLISMNKKIHFVTHNDLVEQEEMHRILNDIAPSVTFDDIITPTTVMIQYLKDKHFDKEIWYLGATVCKKRFFDAGLKLAQLPKTIVEESLKMVAEEAVDNPNIGAVICHNDLNINYVKLLKALVYLKRTDVLFLSGSTEKIINFNNNQLLVGAGCFTSFLEELSGRSSVSFGKPSKLISDYLLQKFHNLDCSRCLFIGDALVQDVMLGNQMGFQTLLVLTGVTSLKNLQINKNPDTTPTFFVNSLSDLNKLMEKKMDVF